MVTHRHQTTTATVSDAAIGAEPIPEIEVPAAPAASYDDDLPF